MANPTIFQIEQGAFALTLVDTTAVGYLDTWQAPGGKTVDAVTMADYTEADASWVCQVTSGALEATQDDTTVDVPATWCAPGQTIPQPNATSYDVALSFLQDPNVAVGLNRYLFENDTKEAYVFLGLSNMDPPKLIGRAKLSAATIGGAARTNLTADVTLPLSRKPDVQFGNATESVIVNGDGTVIEPAPAAASTSSSKATASAGD